MKAFKSISLVVITTFFVSLPIEAADRREIPEGTRIYGDPATTQDKAEIISLIEGYKNAWYRQDTGAWIALHSADTEWINAYARIFQGSLPLADFIENRLFPAFDPKVSKEEIANMKTISTRYLGDDAAVVHMYTDGNRGRSRNEGEDMRRTHFHLVLSKSGSDWKIVHTVIMDAR